MPSETLAAEEYVRSLQDKVGTLDLESEMEDPKSALLYMAGHNGAIADVVQLLRRICQHNEGVVDQIDTTQRPPERRLATILIPRLWCSQDRGPHLNLAGKWDVPKDAVAVRWEYTAERDGWIVVLESMEFEPIAWGVFPPFLDGLERMPTLPGLPDPSGPIKVVEIKGRPTAILGK